VLPSVPLEACGDLLTALGGWQGDNGIEVVQDVLLVVSSIVKVVKQWLT
jgi:hypothetical protein